MRGAHDLLSRWPALDASAKQARLRQTFHFSPGPIDSALNANAAAAGNAAAALWRRDPSAWSDNAEVQNKIANRLGWLDSPGAMADALDRLLTFASSVKRDGFTDVVLLGMGGSSLAPEVLRAILGVAPGWPRLHVIDSTDPAAVRAAATRPERTLYILASKSGTTLEPNALAAHFRSLLEDSSWAAHFVAITDEGTPLARFARSERFRDLFINPSDVGGRYSALSYFGLVPAALMGQNITAIIGWALAMLSASEADGDPARSNPAVALGLAIGSAARAGRDKLTLVQPPALEPFGLWVEQLIAESTGKEGTGVVPIAGEQLGPPTSYGSDRLFVRLRLHGSYAEEMRDSDIRELQAAQQPVVEIELPEPAALGAEFVRWEIATAIAGALLGINPFDEPNVQQAKDVTRTLLERYKADHRLEAEPPDRIVPPDITLTLTAAARRALDRHGPECILTLVRPGDYVGLLAYVGPDHEVAAELAAFRHAIRDRTGAATMLEYGPRYLHSTGQLHKGGPNTGVFIVITATPRRDIPVPGEPFSFGTLELAQALGDFASLGAAGRRALHVHLPAPDRRLLRELAGMLLERVPRST